MIACISLLTPQYRASDALVLPVDAQAARRAPIVWACVNAAVMPLSLKLPDGFMPFVLQKQIARLHADESGHAVATSAAASGLRRS